MNEDAVVPVPTSYASDGRVPVHLAFHDITYTVPQGKKGSRTILNHVSGFVKPGEILAVMGPSGMIVLCNCTQLLTYI